MFLCFIHYANIAMLNSLHLPFQTAKRLAVYYRSHDIDFCGASTNRGKDLIDWNVSSDSVCQNLKLGMGFRLIYLSLLGSFIYLTSIPEVSASMLYCARVWILILLINIRLLTEDLLSLLQAYAMKWQFCFVFSLLDLIENVLEF